MAEATTSLSPNIDLEHALRLVKAAGYRVSKPKRKLTSRGPTCVVRFANGITCRMTTHCHDDALDFERGYPIARITNVPGTVPRRSQFLRVMSRRSQWPRACHLAARG
jgi:hypothetical protein